MISFKCPEAYLEGLNQLIRAGIYPSRSEAIRVAIRDLLRRELWETGDREDEVEVGMALAQEVSPGIQVQTKPIKPVIWSKGLTNGPSHLVTSSLLGAILKFHQILRDALNSPAPEKRSLVSERSWDLTDTKVLEPS